MTKMVNVYSAKTPHLLVYAQTTLGLPVDERTSRDALIAQIISANGSKEIPVQDEAPAGVAGTAPVGIVQIIDEHKDMTDAERKARDSKTVRIIIAKQKGVPGGDEPVQVGVNGSFMLIDRGVPQDVPWPWYHALMNAVQDIYEPLENGGISSTPNKVPLYPVSAAA